MKYRELRASLAKYPFFTREMLEEGEQVLVQCSNWTQKGLLYRLKRGVYVFNDMDRKTYCSDYHLANSLYQPSYISLEAAMEFYGLIPERVYETTSVTTKKTAKFSNQAGRFTYKSIACHAFNYFVSKKDEFGFDYNIAIPEKALCDYFYFKVKTKDHIELDFFDLSLRLQNYEILDIEKLIEIAHSMKSRKVRDIVGLLIRFIQEEGECPNV